ncbi:hypothetical protein L0156_00330 [bacterium]|nr:hypothetical protein [bacterium]
MSTITRNQFVNELSAKHGVIDVNNLSDGLKKSLEVNGISENQLRAIAGPDGQIKGKEEFQKLYKAVDRYEIGSPRSFETHAETCGGNVMKTTGGKLFDAFKNEVEQNRLQSKYGDPGIRSRRQPELKMSDALVVPAEQRKNHVILDVKHVNQMDLYPTDDEKAQKACREAAEKQLKDFNKANHKPSDLNGPDQAIQIAYGEDKNGRLKADSTQAQVARDYIDKKLENGQPVLVGVSHDRLGINKDKMTDHFVTIIGRGYDKDGRLYYQFRDPGAAKGHSLGKFYVDQDTGKLFKQGDGLRNPSYVRQMDYEVTQVRTYKGD